MSLASIPQGGDLLLWSSLIRAEGLMSVKRIGLVAYLDEMGTLWLDCPDRLGPPM